jgi:hypothetical protein
MDTSKAFQLKPFAPVPQPKKKGTPPKPKTQLQVQSVPYQSSNKRINDMIGQTKK